MPPAFIVVTLQTFASRWYSIQNPFLLYPHHIFLANSVKGSKVQLEKTIKCNKERGCVRACVSGKSGKLLVIALGWFSSHESSVLIWLYDIPIDFGCHLINKILKCLYAVTDSYSLTDKQWCT